MAGEAGKAELLTLDVPGQLAGQSLSAFRHHRLPNVNPH